MISIHAPLRERLAASLACSRSCIFQSTLPCGSDSVSLWQSSFLIYFNPRSLAGATQSNIPPEVDGSISIHAPLRERPSAYSVISAISEFQSTLPYGSDSIKTKYFSIHLNQAFIANRLNSNPQRFYFDVRKLLVSHSSSSCEPKLNFMFHITSHRINLDYFSSCQSICK